MPIKIPQLPPIPAGTITGNTSIPVAKTNTDPKTYKMTLSQTLAWLQSNGLSGGGGYSGFSGFSGFSGVSGTNGTVGPSGATGGDGRTSYGLQLVASSYVFQASSNAAVGTTSLTATPYNPTSITLYAVPQNLTGTATFAGQLYDINNTFIGTPSFSGTGNTRALTNTQFGSAYSCVVTASIVSGTDVYYDITTITRLQDATDALQGYLTNPAIVLASEQNGTLGPGEQAKATGLFQVFYGLNEVTSGVTYSVVGDGATSLITPVSAGGIDTVVFSIGPTTGIYTLDSINDNVIGASAIFRAQVFGKSIDRAVTLSKSRQGVTGPAGSAQAVFLNADTQVFTFDNTGTPTPSSQVATFNAVLSIISGFVQWSGVQYYTDGTSNAAAGSLLTNTTSSNVVTLTVTNFASALTVGKEVQSFVVSASHIASGLSDAVRVVKVTSGGQGFTSFLTNQNHTIGADSTGAVTTPLSAGNGYFRIYQGSNLVDNQYVVYGIKSTTSGMGVSILTYPTANASYYVLTAFNASLDTGSTILTATYSPVGGSPVTFEQVFSVTKSKAGPVGDTGPGIVYRGIYNTSTSYFRTSARADVVVYPGNSGGSYYLAVSSGLGSTLGTPGAASGWSLFGAQFESVATKLLLAEDATILKTLVMGYQTDPGDFTGRGIIRSYGTSDWNPSESPQDGFWLGMDSDNYAKFRVGSTSNNLVWDGVRLSLSYGNSGILLYSGSSATDMYLGMNTTTYEGNGIWLGRAGNSTTGVYKMSLVSPNGRSMKWTGNELVLNGATSNLATSGTIYLNKTGPDNDSVAGFWLGVSANNAYFTVGSNDSWLKYNDVTNTVQIKGVQTTDGIVVTSGLGMRYNGNNGAFTITAGSANSVQNGAQIDLVGNDYPTPAAGGQLVLQAGVGAQSTIALHTNNSYSSGGVTVGVQRMVIGQDGRVTIARQPYTINDPSSGWNAQAGSLWVRGNASIGVDAPDLSLTTSENGNVGILRTSNMIYSPIISATNTLGILEGGNSYTIGTNGWGNRTVTDTPGIPGSGTGNNGDIYLVYS
jgi:hypothetical protein